MLAIEPVEVNLVKVSDTLRLVKEADLALASNLS